MLLIRELPCLLGEFRLPVVMVERAGLQFGGEPLLIGDGMQLRGFPFLPLADELLLLFNELLPCGFELRLRCLLLFAVVGEDFVLMRLVAEFAREQVQALIELRFQLPDAGPLFVERGLCLRAAFFQAAREIGLPLVGGGDFQSLVVHRCCALGGSRGIAG